MSEERGTPPEAGQEGTVTDRRPPHILVVDDDPITRLVAKTILAKHGFRVSEAANGALAMEQLGGAAAFALIVLDVEMPVMSGPEVLKHVRGSTSGASVPVLFLTGSESTELEARLMQEGANGFIRKPLRPAPFLAQVDAALRAAAS